MADIDPTALTALIISIVALVATMGQLLQQYFATADGYRRCSSSVMGRWGTLTERRWRWSEFRFETIYFVPKISVGRSDSIISPISINGVLGHDGSTIDYSRMYALGDSELLLQGPKGIVVHRPLTQACSSKAVPSLPAV